MINAFRFGVVAPPMAPTGLKFEFITIGDPGNVADSTTYGAVDYKFQISKYAVSISDIIVYNNDHLVPSDEYAYELDQTIPSISEQQGVNTNSWDTYVRISGNGQWMVAGDTPDKTVRLYKRNVGTSNTWLQEGNSVVATEAEDTGISVDVSNGGTIVFSSPLYDTTPGNNEGRVRVWSLTSGSLFQKGSDFVGAVGEELGTNVTIANSPFTGDIMIAFCSRNGDYVKVYEYSNFTWTQVGSTISLNAPSRLRFSDTGSRLIVGSEITSNGKVQVYEWSGSAWGQIGSDISDLLSWNVGRSVDITGDGNTIAIGGYRDGVTTTGDEGFVKVYEWSGSSWDEKGNAEINGPSANSFYGSNIALDDTGTQVVVGNQLNTLLVYQWNGSSWSNSHTITGSAAFGRIAASNSTGEIIITNDYSTGDVYTYINDRRLIPGFQNFSTGDNRPAQGLTWNYAARFVNWLNKRDGYEPAYKLETFGANDNISLLTAGDNGYDAGNKFRHSRSVYYLPTEDEWFKAAFYDPNKPGGPGYWLYGVGQDTTPTAVASGTSPGTVVYDGIGTTSAPVTAAGGLSPYGTMGQTGNTYEWMESASDGTNDVAGESRVNRGGTYVSGNSTFISRSYRTSATPATILISSSSRSLRVAKRNVIIIDNADTGFTTTAGWSEYTGNATISGYNVSFFSAPSGTGSEVATWTFKGLDPGDYEVATTWRERDVYRATDAPFTVFDGNIALSTVDVDMSDVSRPRADYLEGTLAGSEPFEVIFPLVNITSGTLKVELTDNADDYVIADAVRIQPLPSDALNYTWTQIGSDINGTGVGDQTGYRVDLNDAGDIVAMTSPFNTDGGADSGEIRVFERSGNSWIQVGSDIEGAPGEYPINPGNGLHSVALNGAGDVIATGWPGNDEFGAGNNDSGQVRVYKNVSNTWTLTGGDINPLASNERLGANEGVSLNTEGNIVAVGSWLGGDATGFSDPGVVRVFEMNAGTWSQIGQTLSGETTGVTGDYNQSADYFGQSARLNGAGDILVVGAPGNDNNNYPSLNYAGHVRVFRYNTGTWNQIGSDIDGGAAELQFGFSTSINTTGNIIAVGGYGTASNTGIVRIFENIADTWTQIGSDIVGVDANDRTGYSVSLNGAGDIVAVGDVIHDNVDGTNIGRMRTFKNVAGVWEELAPEVTGLAVSEFAGASVALNKVGDITAVGVIGTSTGSVRMYSGGFS